MVIGRGADAAEAEHHVAGGQGALQRGGEPRRIVALVFGPGEAQAALLERADQEAEVLVFAFADKELVADDQRAEQALRRLLRPALELFEAADVLAVDEHLRHRAAAGDRADDTRAIAVV
jgi:hypothetical protein